MSAVILGSLLVPGSAVPKVGFDGMDVLVHVSMFAAWSLAAHLELRRWSSVRIVGVGLALALLTELLQLASPGRTFSWTDIAADAVGLGVVALVFRRR